MKVYIKNKLLSLSGKSFVTDGNGNPVYNVKGRVFSPTRLKQVCTLDGTPLYRVRNRFFNFFIHSSFIQTPDKQRIAKVKDRLFSVGFDIDIDGANYSVEGKWFSLESRIVRDGQVIGIIRRNVSQVKDLFRDSFELEANENDMPFMIALVIAIDNICDNRRN